MLVDYLLVLMVIARFYEFAYSYEGSTVKCVAQTDIQVTDEFFYRVFYIDCSRAMKKV